MKVVILAGGFGTRISEESNLKPKPMIEIGGMPIIWHIMKIYSSYGFNDFIVCCGYKGYVIKEYFLNYHLYQSDISIDLKNGTHSTIESRNEDWSITLVDTGISSMTGGRIKSIQKYIGDEDFMLTYGDGLSNVDIAKLVKSHKDSKKYATVTAVSPPGRFGALNINSNNSVDGFVEKPKGDGGKINGGFFVCSSKIFQYINSQDTVWEAEPLQKLATDGQLNAFIHNGFWKPMDTLRDKNELETLWENNSAPWKLW